MNITKFTFEKTHQESFIALPWAIYRNDLHWIPPFKDSIRAQLSPDNIFFTYGKMVHFLVSDGKEPLARVSAILNNRLQEEGKPIGLLGFFECHENYDAAKLAIDEAVAWLKSNGAAAVRGPINTSTWHSYRFMTAGFDLPPFFLEPYNKPYYPAFFERYGFQPVAHYLTNRVTDWQVPLDKLEPKYRHCLEAGYRFRPIDMRYFEQALQLLYRLTVTIFSDNWGYSEITWEEFHLLYDGMGSLLEPRLVLFAYDLDERPVGFFFCLPDYAEPIRRMNGNKTWWARLKFLAARHRVNRVILKTLGVLPEVRNAQVGSALTYLGHRNAAEMGYEAAIHALIFQDNYSRRISEKGGEAYKEYAVYELRI